jgi:hypothetical protein
VRLATGVALAVTVGLAACTASPRDPLPPPVPTSPAPVASAVAVATATAAPRASLRLRDARWLLAQCDDPLDKARLAVAVGAAELVAALDDGDPIAATALAALPQADDGEIALGHLGDLLRGDARARRRVLAAILGVAGQPRRQREALDPEGARRCGEALLALAADEAVPREERVVAVSAARALAERGYVERARIPDALDAKSR